MSMERNAAQRFCTEKLARLIHDHVDCALEDRAETDWLTAERYLNAHPEVVTAVVHSTWPESFSAPDFEKVYGEHVYRQAYIPLIKSAGSQLPRPPYGAARYYEPAMIVRMVTSEY